MPKTVRNFKDLKKLKIGQLPTPIHTRSREHVKPVFLAKLADHLPTNIMTGRTIGISGSHVGVCLKNEECPLTVELAAQAAYTAINPQGGGDLEERFVSLLDDLQGASLADIPEGMLRVLHKSLADILKEGYHD